MSFSNRYQSVYNFISRKHFSGDVYRLVLEISNACNLQCAMCPRNSMERKVEFMDKDLFEKIIKDNKDSLEFVSLNGYGEPLLHPELSQFLTICKENGVKTGISTNCTLLDEDKANSLLKNPADVIILAIDGANSESYEKVRVGAKFDTVIENVKRFLNMRKNFLKRTFVVLQCIYMTETKDQIKEFKNLFKGLNYDAIRIRQLTHSGRDREDPQYAHSLNSCSWLWNEPMILSNGDIVPCCQDVNAELKIGNINDAPLKELWNNEIVKNLRDIHLSNKRSTLSICRQCNMYQPNKALLLCSSLFNTNLLNKLLPRVETLISKFRYK